MKKDTNRFNELKTLLDLKHFLPTQSPLKDFIHHNTLHALQNQEFHSALHTGSVVFGYKTYLPLVEYRALYHQGNILGNVLRKIIVEKFGPNGFETWENKLIHENIDESVSSRIGQLRSHWANNYHLNLDKAVHPILFRYISNFLDQGIATKTFPVMHKSFLSSMRSLELNSLASIFSTPRAKHLLLHTQCKLEHLLDIVVGDPDCFETYLFDQQFAHPGWSGMVAVLEENPHSLLDQRTVSLHDFIAFELLLEIDTLDSHFGENWKPIALSLNKKPLNLFRKIEHSELFNLYAIWQEAYEWTYYNNVLGALQNSPASPSIKKDIGFDALFCIDDRECSFRRHIEDVAPDCNTFGTPGHFGIDCYFQPEHGKFYTKICPAPLSPKHIIRELHSGKKTGPDTHYSNKSHSLILGWLISQTIGFWSAFKLFLNIFKPTIGPATTYSFRHVHKESMLTIENKNEQVFGLQIGYKVHEMADRVESVLKSIGLTKPLSSIVYVIGHGASSINNTHYAGYDCGACSGRPGSVNARAFSYMANQTEVRKMLADRGILLSQETQFIGALHDTTRDEIEFYDVQNLTASNQTKHLNNTTLFKKALEKNAVERSRRFILIDQKTSEERIHNKVKLRSVSLFEPRPELNHATNTLCIIGPREFTKHVFLDRRAFLNSYAHESDTDGSGLLQILGAAAPVCGGINLEYYFSRVDNYRLGAGTKLPHNVMGLIGVANGTDGDLLTGLPKQMIEVHDPMRLLMVVKQCPEIILKTLASFSGTEQWFNNKWVHLACIHPKTNEVFIYQENNFKLFQPLIPTSDLQPKPLSEILTSSENLPVFQIQTNL